jgi:hypothetical protein
MVQRPGPPLEARGGKNPHTTIMLMSSRMSRLRLVLAGALARYPQGAGHWACFLQHILGLRDLGHDVLWLDVLVSTGTRAADESRAQLLFRGRPGIHSGRLRPLGRSEAPHPTRRTGLLRIGLYRRGKKPPGNTLLTAAAGTSRGCAEHSVLGRA